MLKSLFPTSKDKKIFICLLILCGLYVLPIILADFTYQDDYERLYNPGADWNGSGRLFATFIYKVLTFSQTYLLNLFLLNLLIFALLMACSCYLLYKVFLSSWSTLQIMIALSIFAMPPFVLQIISYKFDAIIMGVAYFLAVLSFYCSTKKALQCKVLAFVFLLLSLFTYQPFISLFIALCFVYAVLPIREEAKAKESFSFLLIAGAIAIIGFITYDLISAPFIGEWMKAHNDKISLDTQGVHILIKNVKNSLYLLLSIFDGYTKTFVFLILPCLIGYGYGLYLTIQNLKNDKSLYTILRAILFVCSPLILLLITLMSILPLASAVVQARVVVAFGAMLLLYIILVFSIPNKYIRSLGSVLSFSLAFYFFIMPFAYGTILKVRKQWGQSVIQHVGNYLANHAKETETINTLVMIDIPHQPKESQHILTTYPILERIIQISPFNGFVGKKVMDADAFIALSNIKTIDFVRGEVLLKVYPQATAINTADSTQKELFIPTTISDSILILQFKKIE